MIAAFAAAVTVVGAAVMRRWDGEAGKQVADLTRARAGDEWRHEERVAELETDLEESRELRGKLEQKLRAKRAELQGLRNEHAALLRRYATAETERASALEGRRLLELETLVPAQATARDVEADADADTDTGTKSVGTTVAAKSSARALTAGSGTAAATADSDAAALDAAAAGVSAALGAAAARTPGGTDDADGKGHTGRTGATDPEEGPAAQAVFSPEGSSLFLRARAALAKFDGEVPARTGPAEGVARTSAEVPKTPGATPGGSASPARAGKAEAAPPEDEATGKPEAARDHTRAAANPADPEPADAGPADLEPADLEPAETASTETASTEPEPTGLEPVRPVPGPGHFTVPTAVAVVPAAAPVRRPEVHGGFDFFGTQKETASAALDAVQNEDLADVVGQEALALHKAESEARFKPVDEESRGLGAGQVIDLTAHDETEVFDLKGLRSAVS